MFKTATYGKEGQHFYYPRAPFGGLESCRAMRTILNRVTFLFICTSSSKPLLLEESFVKTGIFETSFIVKHQTVYKFVSSLTDSSELTDSLLLDVLSHLKCVKSINNQQLQ